MFLYNATCAGIGVILIGVGIRQRIRLRASENWVAVPGKITATAVSVSRSSNSAEYNLAVNYDYAVDGVTYTGHRIEFGRRNYARKKTAQAKLEQYPVGSPVMVYVNPEKPGDAVLVRSAPYNALYFVLGILMLALGMGLLFAPGGNSGAPS